MNEGPLSRIAPYYKAFAGAFTAFLSALVAGLVDGNLSWSEIITALIALIVAGGAVFRIPNIPNTPPPEPVMPPDPEVIPPPNL